MPAIVRAPVAKRRNETRDLVRPIIAALNKLPNVRVVRNANLGPVAPWSRRMTQPFPLLAGLGPSSPDVVGVLAPQGRLLCLEVKWPDTYPDAGQRAWLRAARSFGAVAEIVHSVAEALDVVELARAGDRAREAARELLARCDVYVATEAEVDEALRERRSDVLAVLRGDLR